MKHKLIIALLGSVMLLPTVAQAQDASEVLVMRTRLAPPRVLAGPQDPESGPQDPEPGPQDPESEVCQGLLHAYSVPQTGAGIAFDVKRMALDGALTNAAVKSQVEAQCDALASGTSYGVCGVQEFSNLSCTRAGIPVGSGQKCYIFSLATASAKLVSSYDNSRGTMRCNDNRSVIS